jgi:hypothetical protein
MTWVLIAWSVFGIVAVVVYGSQVGCSGSEAAVGSACQDSLRKGFGVLFFLWFLVFTLLGIVWIAFLTWRRPGRNGEPVAVEQLTEQVKRKRPSGAVWLILVAWALIAKAIVSQF